MIPLLSLCLLHGCLGWSASGPSSQHDRPACQRDVDVVVLGAGIAGIKAAATLYEGGVTDFVVLEQAGRIGGRMLNVEWEGSEIELGANWIEGVPQDQNPIWAIAQEIGLRGNYTNQESDAIKPTLFDSHGQVPAEDAKLIHEQLEKVLFGSNDERCRRRQHNLKDIPLRDALTQSGWPTPDAQTPLQRTLEFFVVDWDFEYPPEEVSLFNFFEVGKHRSLLGASCNGFGNQETHTGAWPWEPRRFFVTDPRGYAAVVDHIAKPFLSDDRLVLNTSVTEIHYNEKGAGLMIKAADSCVYRSQAAVVTFSSGVINKAVQSSNLFYPPLPEWKARAYDRLQNGIYTKIFLHYSHRFWANADYALFADPSRRGYYAVWQDMESNGKFFPASRNILMVTVVQADSERVESQPQSRTVAELQSVLRQMYGPGIPEPEAIYFHKWYSDPYFRGCWSNVQVGTTEATFDSMQKEINGLFFAGEATDFHYNGFTLGGYNSGTTVGKNVLAALRVQGRPKNVFV